MSATGFEGFFSGDFEFPLAFSIFFSLTVTFDATCGAYLTGSIVVFAFAIGASAFLVFYGELATFFSSLRAGTSVFGAGLTFSFLADCFAGEMLLVVFDLTNLSAYFFFSGLTSFLGDFDRDVNATDADLLRALLTLALSLR